METRPDERARIVQFLSSRAGWVFCGFALIAGFYLLLEHRAHVFGALPYLLILLCPLMHVFMHRGHGHRGHDHGDAKRGSDR